MLLMMGCRLCIAVYVPESGKSLKNAFDFTKSRFVSRGVTVFP